MYRWHGVIKLVIFTAANCRMFHTKYIPNSCYTFVPLSIYTDTWVCMYACNTYLCISTHTYLDMLSSIVLIIGRQCCFISLKYLCWYLPKMSFNRKIWEKDSTSLYRHQMTAALHFFVCIEKHQDYLYHFLPLSYVSYLLT